MHYIELLVLTFDFA